MRVDDGQVTLRVAKITVGVIGLFVVVGNVPIEVVSELTGMTAVATLATLRAYFDYDATVASPSSSS